MASLREWIALTLSALLFSVVAGYGVGRALNARNDGPPPRPAAPEISIVDLTGEAATPVGDLSASEMALPAVVAAPVEAPPPAPLPVPPIPLPPANAILRVSTSAPQIPATPVSASAPQPAAPPTLAPPSVGERASIVVSFADQRLYLMAGDRELASYRVRFGFDPARVKPGETRVQAKAKAGRTLETGWKGYPVVAGGDRGFVLSAEDFDAVAARVPVGASFATTRDRVQAGGRQHAAPARIEPPVLSPSPHLTPAQSREIPPMDAAQPAFLAAAPKHR